MCASASKAGADAHLWRVEAGEAMGDAVQFRRVAVDHLEARRTRRGDGREECESEKGRSERSERLGPHRRGRVALRINL